VGLLANRNGAGSLSFVSERLPTDGTPTRGTPPE